MKANNWGRKSKARQVALKYGYKSGLELDVSKQITEANYPLNYETEKLEYIVPETKHTYTPDFIFTKKNGAKMYVETKGRWTNIDRKKTKNVLASNPGIDLRFVFQNPNQKITKNSKTTYAMHALKIGVNEVAKMDIPEAWLKECVKIGEEPNNPQKFFG